MDLLSAASRGVSAFRNSVRYGAALGLLGVPERTPERRALSDDRSGRRLGGDDDSSNKGPAIYHAATGSFGHLPGRVDSILDWLAVFPRVPGGPCPDIRAA